MRSYTIEPKCICTYALVEQNGTKNNANQKTKIRTRTMLTKNKKQFTNEILCEKNGVWLATGNCNEDEYCAGPDTIEDAACGKKELCVNKGGH